MQDSDRQQLHAVIFGRVQGVSFRYYTVEEAGRLGVTGWVRNRPDRAVEVRAEGTKPQLDALLRFLHRGSPAAHVTRVETEWLPATGEFTSFDVRYSSRD